LNVAVDMSYRIDHAQARARRRDAAQARAKTSVDIAAIADPLEKQHRNGSDLVPAIAISISLHVAVVVLAFAAKSLPMPVDAFETPVQVQIVERAEPAPTPTVAPTEEPIVPPVDSPTVRRIVKPKDTDVPPDPIDVTPPPPPTADSPKEPPRRVVGIDMESTVVGGSGPSLAVGNSRMGTTSSVAQDPKSIAPAGATFTPPKRTRAPTPEYPPALREKGIEGDVGLRVVVGASGEVKGVSIIDSSEHDEFDRAAIAAANASVFEPAKVNGVAVEHAIEFTVRFRLRQ
jgi:protein TonB